MKGRPLMQVLLVCIGAGLAGIPVWHLTANTQEPAPIQTQQATTDPGSEAELTVESSGSASVTISSAGQVILERSIEPDTIATIKFEVPAEGTDLVAWVRARGAGRFAVRVSVLCDGESLADTTLWGETEFTETLAVAPPR